MTSAIFLVFHGALHLFFAQEDFRGIAVAKGLLPPHDRLWRWVSVQGFMDVFYPLFGDSPGPYHLVVLMLHAANSYVLYLLLSRQVGAGAAFVGAALYSTHPVHFAAMYWQSARSDVLGASFALLTVALATSHDRMRWMAVPAFAFALLSKESFLLLPVGIWLLEDFRNPARWDLFVVLALLSISYAAFLFLGRGAGVGFGTGSDAAYAISLGRPALENLLTYLGWTVDVGMHPSPLRFVDVRDPDVYWLGLGGLAIWAAGCLKSGLRERGWHLGGIVFLLMLAPVLALRNHTYHYFLYAPLMGAAWCVAAGVDLLFSPWSTRARPSLAAAWIGGFVTLALLTWNGQRLVHRMETRPMRVYPELRGDPIVSRAIVAKTAIDDLKQARLPAGVDLVFVLRERLALAGRIMRGSGETPPPEGEIYPETNLRTALYDGYGVRALVPGLRSVRFVRDSIPVSPSVRYAVYAPEGHLEIVELTQLDSLLRSSWVRKW